MLKKYVINSIYCKNYVTTPLLKYRTFVEYKQFKNHKKMINSKEIKGTWNEQKGILIC